MASERKMGLLQWAWGKQNERRCRRISSEGKAGFHDEGGFGVRKEKSRHN
jgi:hypothetical protein